MAFWSQKKQVRVRKKRFRNIYKYYLFNLFMRGLLVIQTVLIFLITSVVVTLLPSWPFIYLAPLVLGLLPLIYRNKIDKKEILKLNIISSIIAIILIAMLYFFYVVPLQNTVSRAASSGADLGALGNIVTVAHILSYRYMLTGSFIFLALFNIPFIIYYLFSHKERQKTL